MQMKKFRKVMSLILALAMVFALSATAFADDDDYSDYTITVENATIGADYAAYKIFDATYNEGGGVTYTISTSSALYESIAALTDVFKLSANTRDADTYYVTVKYGVSDADVIAAIESLDIESLVTASASTGTDGAASTTVVLDVGEPGYYYVTSSLGAMVTITTGAPAVTVIDKNEIVGDNFHKYIIRENISYVKYDDAAMGDELDFVITSDVPRYEGSSPVIAYQITDSLSDTGMEIEIEVEPTDGTKYITISKPDDDGVVHYYADESLINQFVIFTDSSGKTYTLADVAYDYTLEFTDVREEKINGKAYIVCGGFILTYYTYDSETDETTGETTYDLSSSKYPTDLSIDITYTAYVTDDANHFETNTAVLNYWVSGPDDIPTSGTNSGKTSSAEVLEWDLKILKMDGTDSEKLLEGATFTLSGFGLNHVYVRTDFEYTLITSAEMLPGVTYYYLTADGRWITTPPSSETRHLYDQVNAGPYDRTFSEGEVKVAGASYTVEGTTNSKGVVVFDGLTEGTYTITEITAPNGYNLLDGEITITVAFDSDTGEFYVDNLSGFADNISFDENNELEIIILNNAGTKLPGTGGMGTKWFYIIGAVLVCGAAVVLVTRRRVNHAA